MPSARYENRARLLRLVEKQLSESYTVPLTQLPLPTRMWLLKQRIVMRQIAVQLEQDQAREGPAPTLT